MLRRGHDHVIGSADGHVCQAGGRYPAPTAAAEPRWNIRGGDVKPHSCAAATGKGTRCVDALCRESPGSPTAQLGTAAAAAATQTAYSASVVMSHTLAAARLDIAAGAVATAAARAAQQIKNMHYILQSTSYNNSDSGGNADSIDGMGRVGSSGGWAAVVTVSNDKLLPDSATAFQHPANAPVVQCQTVRRIEESIQFAICGPIELWPPLNSLAGLATALASDCQTCRMLDTSRCVHVQGCLASECQTHQACRGVHCLSSKCAVSSRALTSLTA